MKRQANITNSAYRSYMKEIWKQKKQTQQAAVKKIEEVYDENNERQIEEKKHEGGGVSSIHKSIKRKMRTKKARRH